MIGLTVSTIITILTFHFNETQVTFPCSSVHALQICIIIPFNSTFLVIAFLSYLKTFFSGYDSTIFNTEKWSQYMKSIFNFTNNAITSSFSPKFTLIRKKTYKFKAFLLRFLQLTPKRCMKMFNVNQIT